MNEIHLLHGCTHSWRPDLQTVRNYVSEESLKRYLDARACKYGALSDVSNSDVLTIDDSTIGAARACVLAREAGHEVTLFVNPAHIVRQRSYWFSRFDAILDKCAVARVTFEGREFDLRPGRPLRAFRIAAKARLMALPEFETDGVLDELAIRLKTESAIVPEHARTLSLETLRELIEQGVNIGSHGWDHRDIVRMKPEEVVDDLRLAQDWFQSCLGFSPTDYAVPYGLAPLVGRGAQKVTGMILLANLRLEVGFIGDSHWNRREITSDLQGLLS
jgi:hypothetical protein